MKSEAYRILVIDDESAVLHLLEQMLTGEGYHVHLAKNAVIGLQILEDQPIDLVLSDIHMPEMDGLEFLSKANLIKPHTPVMIMTADPNLPKVRRALKEGALDLLEKPFDLSQIFDVIARYSAKRLTGRVVSLKNREILLVSQAGSKEMLLQRALVATQANVSVTVIDEAQEWIDRKQWSILIFSMGNEPVNIELLQRFQEAHPRAKLVCVAEQYDVNQLTDLLKIPSIDSLVIKNNSFSEAEFIVEIRKLFSRDIFGMEKYLHWGFEPIQNITRHTDDRFWFIEQMSDYLRSLLVSERFISKIEMVADEFLSNALYNAPVDENGKHTYKDTERTIGRQCTPREKCIFSYAYDGQYFAISIQDNFGSIDRQLIFERIHRSIEEKGAPVQKSGGAGLGLYLSFLTLNKFIINIQPGQKTEMIGLYHIVDSKKQVGLQDRSLSIFMEST